MTSRSIRCPSCGTVLKVPRTTKASRVRCGKCKHRFRIPDSVDNLEDTIMGWLDEEPQGFQEDEVQKSLGIKGEESPPAQGDAKTDTTPGKTAKGEIRLVNLKPPRATFEFPARRLTEPSFRCALPRRCLRCGTRTHLQAHVIIYAPHLTDSFLLEAEHFAGALALDASRLQHLSCQEILDNLPKVPNVPEPADRPMPYWICDLCGASGMISGQIEVDSSTGQGSCRLVINNIRRALEFMAAGGGQDTPGYKQLLKYIAETDENPWDSIPQVVQHRLEQWYRPKEDERFLAYIPDRDHARTEDGMAGIVISNKRIVYHTARRHREATIDDPLELQLAVEGGLGKIHIRTPSWSADHIRIDREGIREIRRSLTLANFKANWH